MRVDAHSSAAIVALSSMQSELQALHDSVGNDLSERQKLLIQVQKLDEALEERKQEEKSLYPYVSTNTLRIITLPDPRVVIDTSQTSRLTGTFNLEPVAFEKISNPEDRLPRTVKIYNQIGDIALVQKLYGITQVNGVKYAMMQNLQRHQSVADAIEDHSFHSIPFLSRLIFAYELSATISAMHQTRLLVKTLSDETIFVEKTATERIRPLLSDLKSARDVSFYVQVQN